MKPLTYADRQFLLKVARRRAKGWTQERIANDIGMAVGTLFYRVATFGYEFTDNGLEPMRAPELDPVQQ